MSEHLPINKELQAQRLSEGSRCICCGVNPVTWPRVCDQCQDKEAQAELANAGYDETCRTCGMIYDGGMRCTYCGDIDPTDSGEFSEEEPQ